MQNRYLAKLLSLQRERDVDAIPRPSVRFWLVNRVAEALPLIAVFITVHPRLQIDEYGIKIVRNARWVVSCFSSNHKVNRTRCHFDLL